MLLFKSKLRAMMKPMEESGISKVLNNIFSPNLEISIPMPVF